MADEIKEVLAINSCCKWSLYYIKEEIVKHSVKALGACNFLSSALNIIINDSITVVEVLMARLGQIKLYPSLADLVIWPNSRLEPAN